MDKKQKLIYLGIAGIVIILAGLLIYQQNLIKNQKVAEQENAILANVPLRENNDKRTDMGLAGDETLVSYSSVDSNNNGENETLVVAQNKTNKKTHIYILDKSGAKIYDRAGLLVGPDKVEIKKSGSDSYYSYYLSFASVGTNGYFIRWNGGGYEMVP